MLSGCLPVFVQPKYNKSVGLYVLSTSGDSILIELVYDILLSISNFTEESLMPIQTKWFLREEQISWAS